MPMIQGIIKDLLHVCVTIVVSFYVCLRFNRDTPSSLDRWLTDAPWDAFWMNVYQVMVTTMFGNSVLAWVVAALFVCVDNQDMGVLDKYVRMHRLLHTKHLYRLVHQKHHHYKAPFALCAIYCHPFELVVGNLCLLYTSPSPRDMRRSRMPSSA